jgi:hypothetical protein
MNTAPVLNEPHFSWIAQVIDILIAWAYPKGYALEKKTQTITKQRELADQDTDLYQRVFLRYAAL